MTHYAEEMDRLKQRLLAMASHAESAVARATHPDPNQTHPANSSDRH